MPCGTRQNYTGILFGEFLGNYRIVRFLPIHDTGSFILLICYNISILFIVLTLALWVCQQAYRQCDTGDNCHKHDPECWFSPIRDIFDASTGIPLPKGEWCSCDDASSCRQLQQRCGVLDTDILPQLVNHRLVTTHLHIPTRKDKCHPNQRIEAVERQCKKCKYLYHMVKATNMVLLVENDVRLFLFLQATGQINPRFQKPNHKRRLHIIRDKDIVTQWNGYL